MTSLEQTSPLRELKASTESSKLEAVGKSPSTDFNTTTSDILVTLDKFTLFPKLPAEMRCKIWFHSLPAPRVVEIDLVFQGKWACRSESQGDPSGLLRANKESRAEFLKHYSPFLEIVIPVDLEGEDLYIGLSPYHLANGSVSYIDTKIDSLYISANHYTEYLSITRESMNDLVSMDSLHSLETLICEYCEVKDTLVDDEEGQSPNKFLPNLQTVLVSTGDITFDHLENQSMERPPGEITFERPGDGTIQSIDEGALLWLRIEEAKKLFLDPARQDLAICSTTPIFRGGVKMDLVNSNL